MSWLVIKLFMGGLFKRVTGAFAWAAASTTRMLAVALCVALLGAGWAYRGWSHAKAAHKADAAAWIAASTANQAAQIAQVKAQEAKSVQLAKDNANVEDTLRAQLGARSLAYADRMRADKVCFRAPGPARQGDAPPFDNSAGPDAVVVGRADFDILTGNTARLEAVHQWGEAQISAGVAVPQ